MKVRHMVEIETACYCLNISIRGVRNMSSKCQELVRLAYIGRGCPRLISRKSYGPSVHFGDTPNELIGRIDGSLPQTEGNQRGKRGVVTRLRSKRMICFAGLCSYCRDLCQRAAPRFSWQYRLSSAYRLSGALRKKGFPIPDYANSRPPQSARPRPRDPNCLVYKAAQADMS